MEFEITSSPSSTVLFAGAIAAITLLIGGMFAWFALSTSNLSTSIEHAALKVNVPIYGRTIPLYKLDVGSAVVVTLDKSSALRPTRRTNGIGMPGYAVGWFRLKNGEKALAAVTSRANVVYLRTRDGYSLLLSLVEPHAFIERLKASS